MGLTKNEILKRERIFLRSLSPSIRKTIYKLNPFRKERNREIRALFDRGVSKCLLSRASGLSWIQIFRIVNKKGGEKWRRKN